jgi:hypothetical protein
MMSQWRPPRLKTGSRGASGGGLSRRVQTGEHYGDSISSRSIVKNQELWLWRGHGDVRVIHDVCVPFEVIRSLAWLAWFTSATPPLYATFKPPGSSSGQFETQKSPWHGGHGVSVIWSLRRGWLSTCCSWLNGGLGLAPEGPSRDSHPLGHPAVSSRHRNHHGMVVTVSQLIGGSEAGGSVHLLLG